MEEKKDYDWLIPIPGEPGLFTYKTYAERMAEIAEGDDTAIAHCNADELLCLILRSLGHGEVVEIFENITKWYE